MNTRSPALLQAIGPASHVLMNHRYMQSWDGAVRHRRMGILVDIGVIVGWEVARAIKISVIYKR